MLTYSHFMWDYEPMMYGWREGSMPKARPPADAKAIWEIASTIEDGANGLHPTQKPVETIRRPIDYHTKPGALIYEPFAGSGTALIAAEMTGRRCYAIEQSPAFVDAAVPAVGWSLIGLSKRHDLRHVRRGRIAGVQRPHAIADDAPTPARRPTEGGAGTLVPAPDSSLACLPLPSPGTASC